MIKFNMSHKKQNNLHDGCEIGKRKNMFFCILYELTLYEWRD